MDHGLVVFVLRQTLDKCSDVIGLQSYFYFLIVIIILTCDKISQIF